MSKTYFSAKKASARYPKPNSLIVSLIEETLAAGRQNK